MTDALPHKRLSSFYFWYYGLLGITHPFWALFLVHRAFSPAEIGLLLSVQMGTRIISPNLWGWVADHTGKRMAIIRLGCFLGVLSFAGIFFANSFWSMMLVIAAYSFFWNAVMPQFEALTLDYLGSQASRYSRIRLWGSIGFIVAVILGGYWFQANIEDFRVGGLIFLAMIWISTLFISAQTVKHEQSHEGSFLGLITRGPVLAFLLASLLLQFAHGIYYTFYSLHLEAAGFNRAQVGYFWALSVIAEVALFLVMHKLMTNWSLRGIFVFSLLVTALRWVLIAFFVDSLAVLVIAQCLHAFSFGACHAISIEYLRRFFKGNLRGRGQAIYTSMSFGAGGALGALSGGFLWDISGPLTFCTAAVVTLLAAVITHVSLDPQRQPEGELKRQLTG